MLDIHRKTLTKTLKNSARIPRIVIDTNIFVSGLLNPHSGKPANLIKLLPLRHKRYQLLVSGKICEEYKNVLNRFERISLNKRKKLLAKIRTHSGWINPEKKFVIIEDDPEDNKFIECAVAGKADFIITGDKHLLNVKEFQGIKIITVDKFLKIL